MKGTKKAGLYLPFLYAVCPVFSFHPESLSFRMLKLLVFFTETRSFFLLAMKSSNYEEAYLNTVTNNCTD